MVNLGPSPDKRLGKSRVIDLGKAATGLGLGLLWLLLLTGYTEFTDVGAVLYLVAIALAFGLIHWVKRWPNWLPMDSLRWFSTNHLAPGLALMMFVTGLQISLFLLFAAGQGETVNPPSIWQDNSPAQSQALFLLVAIGFAPVIEEFAFRLWFQGQLAKLTHPALAIVIASLLFTLVHGDAGYSHWLSGLCYGFAFWLSGSVWLPVLLHAGSNGLIALLDSSAAVTSTLTFWSQGDPTWVAVAAVAWAIGVLVMARYWWRQTQSPQVPSL